ncbi:hypothetical protein OE88DRAFT_1626501, partial [Heliocybe sulcata]
MIGGTLADQEKARKLLTQIVNSLSVKMEIGAPMASAYLLGNPDHYTSHRFKTVYWRAYSADGYIMYSVVMDYIYRPNEYENICLYDWVRLSRKSHITRKTRAKNIVDVKPNLPIEQDDTILMEDQDVSTTDKKFRFTIQHPQHMTHEVTMVKESFSLVPNFIGGNLPRRDTGNREFYCTAMLTLFKPWREGKNLREEDETWDDAYFSYNFTPRQQELMNFFNIRYECYDARDDYS